MSYNPDVALTTPVWAPPLSLATTHGITFVFSSSAYLDVSVQQVCFLADIQSSTGWVAPFGHLRITGCLRLPEAFRSLPRPSSPMGAKASPVYAYFFSLLAQRTQGYASSALVTLYLTRFLFPALSNNVHPRGGLCLYPESNRPLMRNPVQLLLLLSLAPLPHSASPRPWR